MSEAITIGIIGGSGLYDMAELTDREERKISTPFGDPSGPYLLGTLRGQRVAFLARHGAGHRLLPSELNFRANIFGMKMLGVEFILSASAVGSLKEEYKPLDIVVPDQFIDRTKGRISTFFGRGLAAHVGFAHPFCKTLSQMAVQSMRQRSGMEKPYRWRIPWPSALRRNLRSARAASRSAAHLRIAPPCSRRG